MLSAKLQWLLPLLRLYSIWGVYFVFLPQEGYGNSPRKHFTHFVSKSILDTFQKYDAVRQVAPVRLYYLYNVVVVSLHEVTSGGPINRQATRRKLATCTALAPTAAEQKNTSRLYGTAVVCTQHGVEPGRSALVTSGRAATAVRL